MSDRDQRSAACLELLRHARVMTLATCAGGSAGPWSAPVYFLLDSRRLYFFSSPEARHIREGRGKTCAASIYRDSSCVEELQGVQMTGKLEAVTPSVTAVRRAAAYAAKYGIGQGAGDALAYLSRAFNAAFFVFIPEEIYFMDNRLGFGSRKPVKL